MATFDQRKAYVNTVAARQAIEGIEYIAVAGMIELVEQAYYHLLGQSYKTFETLAPTFRQEVAAKRGTLQTKFQTVGEAAQEAVVSAYQASRAQGGKAGYRADAPDPYRRFSGGRLLAALDSPEFFVATPDGILFGNKQLLDSAAIQWYKLNFGAAPNAGDRPNVYSMNLFGVNIGALSLAANKPSGSFSLPAGFWRDGEFVPKRFAEITGSLSADDSGRTRYKGRFAAAAPPRRAKGIEARNFLDAGVRVLADSMPEVVHGHYQSIMNDATRKSALSARVQQTRNVSQATADRRIREAAAKISARINAL